MSGIRSTTMAIPRKSLIYGRFYDGFVWENGKQRGVAVMGWDGKEFHSPDGQLTLPLKAGPHQDGFEPNVVGVPPTGTGE